MLELWPIEDEICIRMTLESSLSTVLMWRNSVGEKENCCRKGVVSL